MSKSEGNPKPEAPNVENPESFEIWCFEVLSDFDIRISDFPCQFKWLHSDETIERRFAAVRYGTLQPTSDLSYRNGMTHFTCMRRVEFCDTDAAGIIHFANYYRYMEQAEHELFRSLGLSIHSRAPDGAVYGWPRVAATANFSAPAYYDDLLEIRLTILRRGHRSLTTRYEFWRGDTHLATGEMKTAYCRVPDHGRLEALDIPPEIAEPLDRLMQSSAPSSNA